MSMCTKVDPDSLVRSELRTLLMLRKTRVILTLSLLLYTLFGNVFMVKFQFDSA